MLDNLADLEDVNLEDIVDYFVHWEKTKVFYNPELDVGEFIWRGMPYFSSHLAVYVHSNIQLLVTPPLLVACTAGGTENWSRRERMGIPLETRITPVDDYNKPCLANVAKRWKLSVVEKSRGKRGKHRTKPYRCVDNDWTEATCFFPKQEDSEKWADLFNSRLCAYMCLHNVSLLLENEADDVEQLLYQAVKDNKIRNVLDIFTDHEWLKLLGIDLPREQVSEFIKLVSTERYVIG